MVTFEDAKEIRVTRAQNLYAKKTRGYSINCEGCRNDCGCEGSDLIRCGGWNYK